VDERTDVLALDPKVASTPDSVPHALDVIDLVEDPRVKAHTGGRTLIVAVDRRLMGWSFFPRQRYTVMARSDSAEAAVRSPQTFYDPRTGVFHLDAYRWMVDVLGIDREHARVIYLRHMHHYPSEGRQD